MSSLHAVPSARYRSTLNCPTFMHFVTLRRIQIRPHNNMPKTLPLTFLSTPSSLPIHQEKTDGFALSPVLSKQGTRTLALLTNTSSFLYGQNSESGRHGRCLKSLICNSAPPKRLIAHRGISATCAISHAGMTQTTCQLTECQSRRLALSGLDCTSPQPRDSSTSMPGATAAFS